MEVDASGDKASGSDKSSLDLQTSTSESVVIVNKEELSGHPDIENGTNNEGEKQTEKTGSVKDEEGSDEEYVYSDDFEEDTGGEETDIEDNDEVPSFVPIIRNRISNPELPATVTVLETEWGSKVYLVGTAHFSLESQEDVTKTIEATQPDVVLVELCHSRLSILQLDEDRLLKEAQNMDLAKIRLSIKQSGFMQGIMHLLFLNMSSHITKQLGMAPGGEFRRAFRDAKKIPQCRLQLGDRPIQVTLRRAFASLSLWQKLSLAWSLLSSKDPISKEDVEKCKQKDLLEEMLKEMTGEFPGLSRVFVKERDTFLAHSLKLAAQPLPHPGAPSGFIPSVVVGVVGLGHVPGIKANWSSPQYDIKEIMKVPQGSMLGFVLGKIIKFGVRLSLLGILSFACYRVYRWSVPMVT